MKKSIDGVLTSLAVLAGLLLLFVTVSISYTILSPARSVVIKPDPVVTEAAHSKL